MSYEFKNIIDTYKRIGIKKGDNVLVKGDLRYLGSFKSNKTKQKITEAHYKALSEIIDLKKGTIIAQPIIMIKMVRPKIAGRFARRRIQASFQ